MTNNKKSTILFDGDDALFKSILKDAKVYGEYGCGASTEWVLSNTSANVYSVDTSKVWVEKVSRKFDSESLKKANIHHVDLGEVGDWGRPLTDDKKDDFHLYTNWLWSNVAKPDTVLIDGRFRVCCFLTSLKYAAVGTRILFDDYVNRRKYHVVEQFVKIEQACGRQALFVVPNKSDIDYKMLDKEIANFRNDMD
jgi:hypothetical protein